VRGVGEFICLSVCVCVCPRAKRKTTLAVNTECGVRTLYDKTSARIDPEVKWSNVKVKRHSIMKRAAA